MSFNRSGYIGRAPGDSAITLAKQYFQPTGVTTDFTFSSGYSPGLVDVYRNGVKLINVLDYAATDGSTISLSTPVGVGSTVQVVAYKAFNLATVKATELDTTVTGTTINLGGNITAANATISALTTTVDLNVSGGATVGGTLVANSFSGDGSALTGIANTAYVVSVATTTGNLNVSAAATITGALTGSTGTFSGAVNVDATTDSTSTTTGALIVDGGVGIAKNVYIGAGLSVAGTLTYEDVTSVDSVGLITAKSGVNITGGQLTVGSGITMGIAGVATFSGTSDVHLLDNVKLNIGDGPDLQLSHSGTNSVIDNNTGGLYIRNNVGGDVGGDIYIQAKSGENSAIFTHDGSAALHFNNAKKFETTNDGVVITGIATVGGHIQFSGTDSALTNISQPIITRSGSSSGSYPFDGYGHLILQTRGDGTNRDIVFATGTSGANKAVINSSGYLGIGTITPSSIVHATGDAAASSRIEVDRDNGGILYVGSTGSAGYIQTPDAIPIDVYTAASKRVTVGSGGDVDICGTAAGVSSVTWDASANSLIFKDKSYVKFGDSSDLSIHHEAGNAYMDNGTGDLYMRNSSGQILIRANTNAYISNYAANEHRAAFNNNGSVDLYYDGSSKFSTTNDGTVTTGIGTFTEGLNTDGILSEKFNTVAGKLSDNLTIDLEDGMVHYFSTQETTTSTPNIRYSSSKSLNNMLTTGDAITVTIITTAATAGYSANVHIDGTNVTEEWVGGSAPSAGAGSDGLDILTFNILKTGNNAYKVIGNHINATN